MSQILSSRQENHSGASWVRLLAGPIISTSHFILGNLIVKAFCQTGLSFTVLGVNGLSFILVAITLLAVMGSGYLGLQSYRGWGSMDKGESMGDRYSAEAVEFVHFSGLLLSMLFTAIIVLVDLPIFFLHSCG